MITVKEFMEIIDYKITEGSQYMWNCYGPNAYRLDSWNGHQDGHSVSIIFDTNTQEVYEVSAYDYRNNRAYRLINPDYKAEHDLEAEGRNILGNQAWDDVDYVDLDVDDDFIQKAIAIVAEEEYDTRVQMQVEFLDDELLQYMKLAHDRDITFNQLVEEALRFAIEEHKIREELDSLRPEYDFSDAEPGPVEESIKKIKKKKKGK
jgi:hypothetical protein